MFHITKNLTLTLWCYFPAKKLEIKKTKNFQFFQNNEFYMQNLRFWYQKLKRWMKVSSFRSPCAPCDWSFMTKIDTLFMTKTTENHTFLSRTYLYSPYEGVPPPPGFSLNFLRSLASRLLSWTATVLVIEPTPRLACLIIAIEVG